MGYQRRVHGTPVKERSTFQPIDTIRRKDEGYAKSNTKGFTFSFSVNDEYGGQCGVRKIVVSEDVQVKDVASAGFSLDISAPPAEQKTKPKGPRLPPASKK